MKTEKANELCEFLKDALELFFELLKGKKVDVDYLPVLKSRYVDDNIKESYNEFLKELEENILEYKDLQIIYDYVESTLGYFFDWDGFDPEINSQIINKGFEVSFLLKLKLSIDVYCSNVEQMFRRNSDFQNIFLSDLFNSVLEIDGDNANKDQPKEGNKPKKDERFDFDKMLKECDQYTDTLDKITFIHDTLFDLKQWQLQYDVEVPYPHLLQPHESPFCYTPELYPNFERLCENQIERLEKKLELEKKALTHKAIENSQIVIQQGDVSLYKWDTSVTDLLELTVALHKSDSIKRKDGKPLSRKELIDYFQQIFNIEIKDVEGKLTKATARKKNMTPYLNSLCNAFVSYAEEKEEKLAGRR